jgi:hypothetical protein
MSFLDRIKSLFSGQSDADDRTHHQLQSPTHPEPTARQPTEAEIEAAAAAAPMVAPIDPHLTHDEPVPGGNGVPEPEGVGAPAEGELLDEREDRAT